VSKKKKWILVVDDDEEITKLLGEKLASATMQIQTATRLADATMKIKNQQFACVVLDFMLDQGTAELIINAMRADRFSLNYHTPIILISGKLNPYIVKVFGSQVNGILVKPLDADMLADKVQALCDHQAPNPNKVS
jgi:DNA-binding response OmpR family regulator